MKIMGWCYRCRKVKQVRVDPRAGLLGRGVPTGICDSCAETKR